MKKIGPKKKLAYELTDEELMEHKRQAVKGHFKPRSPENRVPIDAELASKFLTNLSDIAKRKVQLPSDYDRA
jgi:hypothetical protein